MIADTNDANAVFLFNSIALHGVLLPKIFILDTESWQRQTVYGISVSCLHVYVSNLTNINYEIARVKSLVLSQ